ncbi:MAG: hypothetical protein WCI79_01645 [Candidatus Saccharibacteria bacterium]
MLVPNVETGASASKIAENFDVLKSNTIALKEISSVINRSCRPSGMYVKGAKAAAISSRRRLARLLKDIDSVEVKTVDELFRLTNRLNRIFEAVKTNWDVAISFDHGLKQHTFPVMEPFTAMHARPFWM